MADEKATKSTKSSVAGMNAVNNEKILSVLADLAGQQIVTDETIRRHTDKHIVIPTDMSYANAATIFAEAAEADKKWEPFMRTYAPYRPADGAIAFFNVVTRVFGYKPMQGRNAGKLRGVETAYGQTSDVAIGEYYLIMPDNSRAEFDITYTHDQDFGGGVSAIGGRVKAKWSKAIEGLLDLVAVELRDHSIYKGKAWMVGDTLDQDFRFLETTKTDPSKVIYTAAVERQVKAEIFYRILHPEVYKGKRRPVILLQGDKGEGKTLTGESVAKYCEQVGRTFIMGKAGKTDLPTLLRLAEYYAKDNGALVYLEDIETMGNVASGNDKAIADLLEALDGLSNKKSDVAIMLTTNHPSALYDGIIRRMTSFIRLGHFDLDAMTRLLQLLVPEDRRTDDLDFEQIFTACDGFSPSYMTKAFEDAGDYGVARLIEQAEEAGPEALAALKAKGTNQVYVLDTEAFVASAQSTRIQHDIQRTARSEVPRYNLDSEMGRVVDEKVRSVVEPVAAALGVSIK